MNNIPKPLDILMQEFENICNANNLTEEEAFSSCMKYCIDNDLIDQEKLKELAKKENVNFKVNKKAYVYATRKVNEGYSISIANPENKTIRSYIVPLELPTDFNEAKKKKALDLFVKKILFPAYFIDCKFIFNNLESFEEILLGIKDLSKKTKAFDFTKEEFLINKKDVHTLNLFFRKINEDKKFLENFNKAWHKEAKSIKPLESLIYLYAIFFPSNVDIDKLKEEINNAKENSVNLLEDMHKIFANNAIKEFNEPLSLTQNEAYYLFNSIFDLKISKTSILTYSKEMNITLKKVGQRNTQDYKNFCHPFLNKSYKEKFIEQAKEEIKSLDY